MSNVRNRAISVGSAFANLPSRYPSFRRSHSTVTALTARTLRVVVLGVGGVGKTAMTVRFVTKRFIGDYDPTLETIYRHVTVVDDQLVNFEVMDTAGQNEGSVSLEDKCRWGESFILVYDVTDKYSFDELTRLKFIASYTHSRLRVNFTPCWVLIGNKADLSERERMVTIEEGKELAKDLGCHFFREISVKESLTESYQVFEDLWRYFLQLSPRSPSSSQRRKFLYRIQDKISVIDSATCSCAADALKQANNNRNQENSVNEVLVTTLTSTLKRQLNSHINQKFDYKNAKQYLSQEERQDATRGIPRIPENIKEDEEEDQNAKKIPSRIYRRSRRNALANGGVKVKSSSSDDDVSDQSSVTFVTSSSASSSSASLSSLASSSTTLTSLSTKSEEIPGVRRESERFSKNEANSTDASVCLHENQSQKFKDKCEEQSFNHNNFNATSFNKTCPVGGR